MIRVLVVDDDFMVARLHKDFVERVPGYAVVGVAHNGAQALQGAASLHPDLVLLDIYLPDMSGLEVLSRLRRLPGGDMDVFVISAATDVDSLKQAFRGGTIHYLIKPFEYGALRAQLTQYARRHAELAALTNAEQEQVNRVFLAHGPRTFPRMLPKGISQETIDLVQAALRDAAVNGLSATECAELTGLSRSSTRRYLEHLLSTGSAEVRHRYGSAGRPERRYRLRGTS
jgi:response regulator of citrate/malate metabolism